MAKVVKEIPGTGNRKYPWEKWLDGQTWELKRGEDFDCTTQGVYRAAIAAAKVRRKKVAVRMRGEVVYLQAKETE